MIQQKSSKMIEAENYYNEFSKALTDDYVINNPRTEGAIQHILHWLPEQTQGVLDVGCGVGWTSYEVAQKFPNARVVGVDLAPESIKIAQNLFKSPNLAFSVQDITIDDFQKNSQFDAILLIDVYEHIPAESRRFFHQSISPILNNGGRIILTCPTVLHQQWLKTHKPEGLQPVDEEIGVKELQQFAEDIGGEVIYFSYTGIWGQNDYFHAVIERGPTFIQSKRGFYEKLRARLPFKKMVRSTRVQRALKQIQ